MKKLCVNCKSHFKLVNGVTTTEYKCRHDAITSHVTGAFVDCEKARDGKCGFEAKYFEEKVS